MKLTVDVYKRQDTNPVKEDVEYVDSIKADVEWLGFKWEGEPRYASDYFDALYGYAIELLEKGLAYVDAVSYTHLDVYKRQQKYHKN